MPDRERTGVNWYDKITEVPTYDLDASWSGASMERTKDGSGDFVLSEDYNALLARLREVGERWRAYRAAYETHGPDHNLTGAAWARITRLLRRLDPAP